MVKKTIKRGYNKDNVDGVRKEVEMMSNVVHNNILKAFYLHTATLPYFIVSEYCDRGDFFYYVEACVYNTDNVAGKIVR